MENLKAEILNAFTFKHTGKMSDMVSISTDCGLNPYCVKRAQNPGTICAHCYAMRQTKQYKTLAKKLKHNTALLTETVIDSADIPVIDSPSGLLRFEAFGDIMTVSQVFNYFEIARKNPHLKTCLFTKNPLLIKQAIKAGAVKPENLKIVFSSPYLNRQARDIIFTVFPFIDSVFTVCDSETIERNGIPVTCGARSCATCRRCYEGRERFTVEKLK